jgi:hypothetical protein
MYIVNTTRKTNERHCLFSLSLYGLIYCSVESIWCTISNKYLEHINNQWRNTGRWILPEKQPCGIDNIQTKFFSDFSLIFIVSIVMRNSFFSVNMIIVVLDIAIIQKKAIYVKDNRKIDMTMSLSTRVSRRLIYCNHWSIILFVDYLLSPLLSSDVFTR